MHTEGEPSNARDNSDPRSQLPPGIYTLAGHALPGVTCPTWERDQEAGNTKSDDFSLPSSRAAGSQPGDQEVSWEVPGTHSRSRYRSGAVLNLKREEWTMQVSRIRKTDDSDIARPRRLTYSVEEVAEVLGLSRSKTYELVARGDIPVVPLAGRRKLIARATVDRLLDGGEAH
jgi:excisionase family DNA binding protein